MKRHPKRMISTVAGGLVLALGAASAAWACNPMLGESSSFEVKVFNLNSPQNPMPAQPDAGSTLTLAVDGHIRMNITDGSIYPNRDLLLAKVSGGDMTLGVLSDTCYFTPNTSQQVADDIGDVTVVHRGDDYGTHVVTGTGTIAANSRTGSATGTSYMVCAGAKPEYWKTMITLFSAASS